MFFAVVVYFVSIVISNLHVPSKKMKQLLMTLLNEYKFP